MKILTLIFALTTSPLAAAWFEVSPPAPTSETPIAITFTTEPLGDCGPTQGDVSIVGASVHVRLFRPDNAPACPPTIDPRRMRVDVGTLPAGEYTLAAEYQNIEWRGKFVVRNPAVALAVTSRSGGLPVAIHIPNAMSVTFGSVSASLLKTSSGLLAIAPPHAPGLFDIDVADVNGNQTTLRGAVYYFDPTVPPDPTVFEKVLFPVLDRVTGAAGTQWNSVVTVENLSGDPTETFNQLGTLPRLRLPFSSFEFAGHGFPHGALLHIPRQSSSTMAFSLRISESSSIDPGFELVPVRESQFFRGPLTLANVPIGSAYRTKLRIYALDPLPDASLSVSALLSSDRAWGTTLSLQRSISVDQPSYAELDLGSMPELRERDRVTVQISAPAGAAFWAFASAVHSTSQRTVIIRPQ